MKLMLRSLGGCVAPYSTHSTVIILLPNRKVSPRESVLNPNLHLGFRRMDLVGKLNAVAGGMNVKPGSMQF